MPQPPSPDHDPHRDADAELARTAAAGCFAGMSVVGVTILSMLGILVAVILVGVFLIFLTCGGH